MSSCSSTSIKRVRKKPLLSSATNNNINIPEDVLLSYIFIRLRAKQLAQMRTLSKTWNALLSHPSFIQSHLDRSINTNDEILMVFYNGVFSQHKPFTAHPSRSPSEDLAYLIKPPPGPGYNVVIGSVNGLICFADYIIHRRSFRIWNPSISALIALPPYTISEDYPKDACSFRFGFDPKTSDYKLVKIAYRFDRHVLIEKYFPVEVYSMRKDSWEFITAKFPSHIRYIHEPPNEAYVDGYDGHVHWLCSIDTDKTLQTIMAYDLNLETFSEILLPDSIQRNRNRSRRNALGVWSRKLCVISCNYQDGDCEVWVMDKCKVAGSWIKLHVLSGFSGDIVPIGFTLNSKFLFRHDDNLALYDPNASASKHFKAIRPVESPTKVAQYIDSLVWPVSSRKGLGP
uniref:F-box/kelch-repeat protein At3g06240-like n=1 Tax=Erigeron canadensis TaxID=72917 RepID=UPI001CB8A8AC|nr:F-box/kelch-repeat protein At3g06240-like [Erigeron canadensis]